MEHWTYSFSLGAQQTRTLSRPIWSPTLLVSITSNARSGGKPFAHRERASPVHKVTFKHRRNRTKKRNKSGSHDFFCRVEATTKATATRSQKRKDLIRETTLLVYHIFLRRSCTKALRIRRNLPLHTQHFLIIWRGTMDDLSRLRRSVSRFAA